MADSIDLHEIVANAAEAMMPMSGTAVRMAALAANPDVGPAAVGVIAMEDPAIAAILLREANSVQQASRAEIGTVDVAVTRLGVGRSAAIAAFASAGAVMSVALKGYSLSAEDFVRHATNSSIVAELARLVSPANVDATVATSALLHDIGKLLLDQHLNPGHFAAARQAHGTTIGAENELLGLNHAEVGGFLCETWRLPDAVVEAIREHHFTDASQASINSVVVALAQLLADDLDTFVETTSQDAILYTQCLERLELPRNFAVRAEARLLERGVTDITTGSLPR